MHTIFTIFFKSKRRVRDGIYTVECKLACVTAVSSRPSDPHTQAPLHINCARYLRTQSYRMCARISLKYLLLCKKKILLKFPMHERGIVDHFHARARWHLQNGKKLPFCQVIDLERKKNAHTHQTILQVRESFARILCAPRACVCSSVSHVPACKRIYIQSARCITQGIEKRWYITDEARGKKNLLQPVTSFARIARPH